MEVLVKLVPSGVDEDGEEQFMELDAAIIDTLKPMLREAFNSVFQATDTWGQKKGEPKSLAEIVAGKVAEYLEVKLDKHGHSSYSGEPRFQWMVNKAMEEGVKEEIGKHLATLRSEFAAKIATKIAEVKIS